MFSTEGEPKEKKRKKNHNTRLSQSEHLAFWREVTKENLQSRSSCIKAKVAAPLSMCPMPQGNTSLILLSKSFGDIKVGDSLFCNAITTVPLCGSMSGFFVKGITLFIPPFQTESSQRQRYLLVKSLPLFVKFRSNLASRGCFKHEAGL